MPSINTATILTALAFTTSAIVVRANGIGFPAPTLAPRDAVEKRQDSGATDGADLASAMSLASVVESAVMATDTAAFASIASSIYGDLPGLLSSYSAELASIPTSLAYLETSINGVLASASSLISQYGTVGAESILIAQATSEFGMLAGSGTDGLGGVMGGMTAGSGTGTVAATATGQVASNTNNIGTSLAGLPTGTPVNTGTTMSGMSGTTMMNGMTTSKSASQSGTMGSTSSGGSSSSGGLPTYTLGSLTSLLTIVISAIGGGFFLLV